MTSLWEQFRAATLAHTLTVLHESDPYVHLRVAEPGTEEHSWEVMLWPGHLALTTETATLVFQGRGTFLAAPPPHLFDILSPSAPELHLARWADRCTNTTGIQAYSPQTFLTNANAAITASDLSDEDANELLTAAWEAAPNEDAAQAFLAEHEWLIGSGIVTRTWSASFQWACAALALTAHLSHAGRPQGAGVDRPRTDPENG